MRSILFKLSEDESDTFDLIRDTYGVKLTPKKFFLLAVKQAVALEMAKATDESAEDNT